jgi:hypothetical protein
MEPFLAEIRIPSFQFAPKALGHGLEAVSAATTGTSGNTVSLAPTSNGSALYLPRS